MKLAQVFLAGMLISFMGSLPLGMLNVAALQLSISDGYYAAFWFVTGCALVEMVYVRLSLVAMDRIMKHEQIISAMKWLSILVLLALALNSIITATRGAAEVKSAVIPYGIHPLISGILLMAINPMQLTFWFGWNTVLYSRGILISDSNYYNIYPLGIGLGSLLGSFVFIYGGRLMVSLLKERQHILNWILGALFLVFALLQIRKLLLERRRLESADKVPA